MSQPEPLPAAPASLAAPPDLEEPPPAEAFTPGGVLDPDPEISLLRRAQESDRAATVDLTEAVFKVANLLKAAQQRNAYQLLDARLSIHRDEGALGERLHLPQLS